MANIFIRFSPSRDLRARLEKDVTDIVRRNAKPSQQALDSYLTFIASSYEKALKRQLYGSDGDGYASGILYRSIKARINRSNDVSRLHWGSGNAMIIPIEATFDMKVYGYALAENRRPSYAPITELIYWIQNKKRQGTLRADVRGKKEIVNFAFKISKIWKKKGHVAVLPDWWNIKKSEYLQRDFNDIYDGSQKYHIKRLSDSLIANINKLQNKK